VQEGVAGGKVFCEYSIENVRLAVRPAEYAIIELIIERNLTAICDFEFALQLLAKDHLSAQLVEDIDIAFFPFDLKELDIRASIDQKIMEKRDGIRENVIQEVVVFLFSFLQPLQTLLVLAGGKYYFDFHPDPNVLLDPKAFIGEFLEIVFGSSDFQ